MEVLVQNMWLYELPGISYMGMTNLIGVYLRHIYNCELTARDSLKFSIHAVTNVNRVTSFRGSCRLSGKIRPGKLIH